MFSSTEQEALDVSRSDVANPLAAWSKHGFELDGIEWPSVEHYYFWGCGRDGRGENNYGRVLMEVRGKLREISEAG